MQFGEIAKRVMRMAGIDLARTERDGIGPQPVELIPGMPAAPEPCALIPGHWSPATHPTDGVAQVKVDGIRAISVQHRILTRQALPLDCALHCLPALVRLEERFGEPMVFDGEYQEPEGFAATLAAHKRGEGIGVFWLFDAVPYSQWRVNRFDQPLRNRLARIDRLMPSDEPFLAFLAPVDCPTADEAQALASRAWAIGQEGIVVKRASQPYVRGKNSQWQKLKRHASLDGPVSDVACPDGDVSRAVALVRLDGRAHKVAAMPPDIRALILRDVVGEPGGLTGRMVEVEFNERTETGALRGARIIRLRPDKEEGEA